jgi:hypothetical protein
MMKLPPTRKETRDAFEAIARALATDHVELSVMFGMPSLKVDGKHFAGIFGDDVVFKLAGQPHAKALGITGAKLFDPSGTGRAMKEWVVIPYSAKGFWSDSARDALAYARSTPPVEKKKSLAPPAKKSEAPPAKKSEVPPKKKSKANMPAVKAPVVPTRGAPPRNKIKPL